MSAHTTKEKGTASKTSQKWSNPSVYDRVADWERWPLQLFFLPLFFYGLYKCLRAGTMWPFSTSNPGLEFGGFFGMGKMQMYEQLPPKSYPKTILITPDDSLSTVKGKLMLPQLQFPFVAKPEAGMQGLLVRVIQNEKELKQYHAKVKAPWVAQEFIQYKKEFGVFYLRYPNQERGRIVGLSEKIPLAVVGDGKHTLGELVENNPKTKKFKRDILRQHAEHWDEVLKNNEHKTLMYTGNRAQGAKLVKRLDEVDSKLLAVFDNISHYKNSLFYGRFDVKCDSLDGMRNGEFSILEFNGAHSGYGHLYHCGTPMREAYSTVLGLWRELYDISLINHRKGLQFWPFWKGIRFLLKNRTELKKLRQWEKEI